MARQQLQDLLGFREVSTPSATPVDTFTGAPAMPRVNAAGQLADALGIAARYGQKGVAEMEAMQKREQSAITSANVQASFSKAQGGKNYETLRQEFPHADPAILTGIIETGTKNFEETSALNTLYDLPDNVKYNDAELATVINGLIITADKTYVDNPVQRAGAIQGIRAAEASVKNEFARGGKAWARKKHQSVTKTELGNMLVNVDLDNPEQLSGAINKFNKMNLRHRGDGDVLGTSPLDKELDKELYVATLIDIEQKQPNSKATKLIDHIKFLQGGKTPQQLFEAQASLLDSRVNYSKDQAYFNDLRNEEAKEAGALEINRIALTETDEDGKPIPAEKRIDKLRKMQVSFTTSTKNKDIANELIEDVQNAIDGIKTDQIVSGTILETSISDLMVDASLGEITDLREMQKAIKGIKGLSVAHRQELNEKASELLKGSTLLTDASLNKAFRDRVFNLDGFLEQRQARVANFAFTQVSGGITLEDYFGETFKTIAKREIQNYMSEKGEAPTPSVLHTKYKDDKDNGIYGIALAEAREAFAYALENKRMMDSEPKQEQPEEVVTDDVDEPSLVDTVIDGVSSMFSDEEDIPTVTTQEGYDALPSGAQYFENGNLFKKP